MFKDLTKLMASIAVCAVSSTSQAYPINVVDQGWYNDSGIHVAGNANYIVGENANGDFVRNWFVLDLSTVVGTITSATLSAFNIDDPDGDDDGFLSPDLTETWTLYDTTTSIGSLINGTGGVAAYVDLGSGSVFGAVTVSANDNGKFVSVSLNADGLAAMNSAIGGHFALGGALTSLSSPGQEEALFRFSHRDPRVNVELNSVPSPATPVLLSLGLSCLGWYYRRKAKLISRCL